MNPIPATDDQQLARAQFEATYGGPTVLPQAFEKYDSGPYKYMTTNAAWINYSAGWLACSAQQSAENDVWRAALSSLVFHGPFEGLDNQALKDLICKSALVAGGENFHAIATLKARLLLAGHAECAQQAPTSGLEIALQSPDPVLLPVSRHEILRAIDQWGCVPFVVNDQSIAFMNYFIENRALCWHWRQDSEGVE